MTDEIFKFHPDSPIAGCVGRVKEAYSVDPRHFPPTDGWWWIEFDEPQTDKTGMRSHVWDAPETALRRLR